MTRDDRLALALTELSGLELVPDEMRRRLEETRSKLSGDVVCVAVVGDFKRGKSTLVNALLGEAVLPTGVVPVTAVPTLCRWGPRPHLLVRLADAEIMRPLAQLAEFVTEAGNPGNRQGVLEVIVEHPSPLLENGLVLADTPGTGSVLRHNTEAARAFLPRVDVAIVVLTVEAPLSEAEAGLVTEAAGDAARLAVCLNKVDVLSAAERDEAVEFVGARIAALLDGAPVPVFAVSSRVSLERGIEQGGLGPLRAWLCDHVGAQRSAIAHQRAIGVAQQAHRLALAALRMERAALEMPVDQAAARQPALREALDTLELDALEAAALLADSAGRLGGGIVAEATTMIRDQLPERLLDETATDDRWNDIEREAVISRATDLEEGMTEALRPVLERHARRIEERVQHFMDVAADLFSLELPPAPPLTGTLAIARVRIEFADEPGAMAMGIRGVREHLPGRIGRRWRESARHDAAVQAADRLAGRLRYASDQALDRAVRAWTAAVDEQWRSVAGALSSAIDRSQAALASGVETRRTAARRLDLLDQRVDDIAQALRRADGIGAL